MKSPETSWPGSPPVEHRYARHGPDLLVSRSHGSRRLSRQGARFEGLQAALTLASGLATAPVDGGRLIARARSDGGPTGMGSCGARKFLGVTGPDSPLSRYATDAAAAEAIIRAAEATIVIAAGTAAGRGRSRALPRV